MRKQHPPNLDLLIELIYGTPPRKLRNQYKATPEFTRKQTHALIRRIRRNIARMTWPPVIDKG